MSTSSSSKQQHQSKSKNLPNKQIISLTKFQVVQTKKYQSSQVRLINSQFLTIEMALNYLFKWRDKKDLIRIILQRIQKFTKGQILQHMPTLTFIMSISPDQIFQSFAQKLSIQSLSMYLAIRWSYSTFWLTNKNHNELRKSKLDSYLLKNYKNLQQITKQSFSQLDLYKALQRKINLANYISNINDFFERVFKIPQKLKKYQKSKRSIKLKDYLQKIQQKFMKQNQGNLIGLSGVVFPLQDQSYMMMRIYKQYCHPFNTKQRVPFKIVMETISVLDAQMFQNGNENSSEKFKQLKQTIFKEQNKSLILPQTYFGSQWSQIKIKIKKSSPYKICPSYKIRTFMVKSGDDLRQQYMAMQLIKLIFDIAEKQNLKIWLRPYSVIPYNQDSGLIQFVDDTRTVSYLKETSGIKSLKQIYKQLFGENWQHAIINFIQSLAGYSLLQYLFQIKDRHNNNILIDTDGHIIHIDFSFIISSSPGNFGFQKAPFKFTQDYMQIMQGLQSDIFLHYKMLFFLGLKFIRKYKKQIMQIVLMMSNCQGMKCFKKFQRQKMQQRFHENATDQQLSIIVDNIMKHAWNSYSTSNYDRYQWYTNFIYS